jgi:putative transposase
VTPACVLTAQILHALHSVFASVCLDFESQRAEFDGEDDPVHLLVNYPPKTAVAALVSSPKGVSGRLIQLKNHPSVRRKLWGKSLRPPSTGPEDPLTRFPHPYGKNNSFVPGSASALK